MEKEKDYFQENYFRTLPNGTEVFNTNFKGCLHRGVPCQPMFSANLERPRGTSEIGKKAIRKEAENRNLKGQLEKKRAAKRQAEPLERKKLGKAKGSFL